MAWSFSSERVCQYSPSSFTSTAKPSCRKKSSTLMICRWHLTKCSEPCSPAYCVLQAPRNNQPPSKPVGTEPARNGVRRGYWHRPKSVLSHPAPGQTSTTQPHLAGTKPKQPF